MAGRVKRKSLFVCGCLIAVFLAVLQFAELREPQPPDAEARRFGCRRARCSAGSVRSVQEECTLFKFASSASVGAVVVFVPKPAGRAPLRTGICKFCEPPQGGASARTAERRCLSLQATTAPNIFSLYLPSLPPVAYSSLLRSRRTIQNSQFKMHNLSF